MEISDGTVWFRTQVRRDGVGQLCSVTARLLSDCLDLLAPFAELHQFVIDNQIVRVASLREGLLGQLVEFEVLGELPLQIVFQRHRFGNGLWLQLRSRGDFHKFLVI